MGAAAINESCNISYCLTFVENDRTQTAMIAAASSMEMPMRKERLTPNWRAATYRTQVNETAQVGVPALPGYKHRKQPYPRRCP